MNIDAVGGTVSPMMYLLRPHFFQFSVNDWFSMKKTIKLHKIFPSYFLILHLLKNVHYDRTHTEEKNNWEYGPLNAIVEHSLALLDC